jgi:hypothetical protein
LQDQRKNLNFPRGLLIVAGNAEENEDILGNLTFAEFVLEN